MLTYILIPISLIAGFAILLYGAHLLIEGASAIARKLKISELVIGLTIIAFGTSAPELFVNIQASIKGTAGIAIGNILGSNITNIFLVLGASAVIYPIALKKNTIWKEIPLSLLAAIMVGVLANDYLIDKMPFSILTRSDGIVLVAFFIIFMYYVFGVAKTEIFQEIDGTQTMPTLKAVLFTILGIIFLPVGGWLIVDGAVKLAAMLGANEFLIGATIVATGTSLPELITSVMAAYKKKADIAIGNVIGSNIFNIFWILGISAIIKPIPFQKLNNIDILITAFASIILLIFLYINKRYAFFGVAGEEHRIERWEGVMLLILYAGYIAYLILIQNPAALSTTV